MRPLTAAVIAFLMAAVLSGLLVWKLEQRHMGERRAQLAHLAGNHTRAIEFTLERAMSAAHVLATLVHQGNGSIPDFDATASRMLPLFPGASELALAPGGVIQDVTPMTGNERAIGLGLLTDPAQRSESLRARDSGRFTLAGPLELVQGGTAVVGRMPVFLDDSQGNPVFWGFTLVVMRLPEGLDMAHLSQLGGQGLAYELWRIEPDSGQRQVIARTSSTPLIEPVEQALHIPNASWTLSLAPAKGWAHPLELSFQLALGLLFSLLLGYLAKLFFEMKASKHLLEARVAERTAEIRVAQGRLQAILDAIPDPVWLKDVDGVFLNCNPMFGRLYGASRADIIGKTDYDFVEREQADFFREHDRKAMAAGRSSLNEEWLSFADDGQRRLFETIKTPMSGEHGSPIGVLGIARDITERKQAEEQLSLAAKVFEQSGEGIMITDAQRTIVMVNQAFTAITGYSEADALGQTPSMLVSGRHDQAFYRAMWEALAEQGRWQGELWNRRKDGSLYPELLSIIQVLDAQGAVTHYIGISSDITQHKTAQAQIQRLAHFDPLTGLPNRVLLSDRIRHELSAAQRHHTQLVVMFVDLDHFKNVNDTLGHRIGDALLIAVASRLKSAVRDVDTVSRQGGDEFVLILPDTDADGAAHVAGKLLDAIAQPYQVEGFELTVTLSIGIALYPGDGKDFEALSQCADAAMYRAKHDGRNTYRFFTTEMQARSAHNLQMENALRRALERKQLILHYQPQISLDDGRIVGVEALLRWQHPELGMVPPADFIPLAEESGQILQIGEWVLRSAVRQMKTWMDAGLVPMVMAVNLSAVQFR
ncbi:MAG: diguanylate phosphodiesterase, partial [Betaproteobacteria bacterium HGW-Betaproteobacteria-17]